MPSCWTFVSKKCIVQCKRHSCFMKINGCKVTKVLCPTMADWGLLDADDSRVLPGYSPRPQRLRARTLRRVACMVPGARAD